MKKYYIMLLILFFGIMVQADELRVESLDATTDVMISPMQRRDLNGEICALVKVILPVEDCKFEGNVIESSYDVGEYWVYLSQGSKQLKIKCPNKAPLMVAFGDYGVPQLESKRIYNLNIKGYEDSTASAYDESINLILHLKPVTKASISIDGDSPRPFPANGTWTGSLSNGSHTYAIFAKGYADVIEDLVFKKGDRFEKTISLMVPLEDQNHEWVDLGLSVKWATCNVGAAKPSDYGEYYAWGEISPAIDNNYSKEYCKTYGKEIKTIAGDSNYDVACAEWGEPWRIPTKEEWEELTEKCTWTPTNENGHNGVKVTGPNCNSIFLPSAGEHRGANLWEKEKSGEYWSSSSHLYDEEYAAKLSFYTKEGISSDPCFTGDFRSVGHSIRPVME